MYMCIRGVDFVFVSTMCPLYFVPVPTACYYFPLFLLDLHYYHIQFASHVELINILNPLSSSGRQTEEGKYRIKTEEDVCYL